MEPSGAERIIPGMHNSSLSRSKCRGKWFSRTRLCSKKEKKNSTAQSSSTVELHFTNTLSALLAPKWLKTFWPVESSICSSRRLSCTLSPFCLHRSACRVPASGMTSHLAHLWPVSTRDTTGSSSNPASRQIAPSYVVYVPLEVSKSPLFYLIYGTFFNASTQASYEKCCARTSFSHVGLGTYLNV